MKTTILMALGLVAIATVALPGASAHDIVVVTDQNGDGDCSDPGEVQRVSTPTPKVHGVIYLACFPGGP